MLSSKRNHSIQKNRFFQAAETVASITKKVCTSFGKKENMETFKIGLLTGGCTNRNGFVRAMLRQAAKDMEALGAEVVEIKEPDQSQLGVSFPIYEWGRINKPLFSHDSKPSENHSQSLRTKLRDWTFQTIKTNELTAIAYPSSAQLAHLIEQQESTLLNRWIESSGVPSISVPMAYEKSNTGALLTSNMVFLGMPSDEFKLIHIASIYEKSTCKRIDHSIAKLHTLQ